MSEREENNWDITQWSCGVGVVDQCRNQKINWDEPASWQALIDQLIPLSEFGIVFSMQYISSSIGPGTTKAMNSLRCMMNSGVSSTWALGAGIWLLLKYSGLTADLVGTMDEGYLYACTCIYDLNGLKNMLGASEESSAEFSSCSEKAREERIKAREEKESYEEKQREAATQALIDAAKNKKVNDAKNVVEALDGCNLRTASNTEKEKCFAGAVAQQALTLKIIKYWSNMVNTSGGAESTKNREEQTNLKETGWTLEGVNAGLLEMFPDRVDADGNLLQTCTGPAGTLYGDDCANVISQYATDNGTPTALCQGDACQDSISCFRGDSADGTAYTSSTQCDLVELEYGYSQWRDSANITCNNPATYANVSGWANCMILDGSYVSREAYMNVDQPRFRTIGETIAVGDAQGNVLDSDIQCLAADMLTLRSGRANCYPFWIEGANIEIGVKADQTAIKQDQFIWLTNENVTCDKAGQPLTGTENCKVDTEAACNSSQLTRLNIAAGGVCVPRITWKAK